MNNWKKVGLSLMSAGLMTLTPAFASADYCCPTECDPCCSPCGGMDFSGLEVGIDFLYWKPCVDNIDYASERIINFGGETVWRYHDICPEWEPGIRIMAALPDLYCGIGVCASYTYIKSDDKGFVARDSAITSPLIHAEIINSFGRFTDSAKASWELQYQEWDVLFCYNISCHDCHLFTPFFGIAGLDIDQDTRVTLTDDAFGTLETVSGKWNSDFWGVGFRIGSNYEFRMSDCLRIFASSHGTIIAGESDGKLRSESDSDSSQDSLAIKDDDCCHIIPGFHVGAGILYDTCICGCLDVTAKLGYEFLVWHNVPNNRVFPSDNDSGVTHGTSSNVRTVGFHGLMAGLALNF